MRDESKDIIEKIKKGLKEEFEEWRDAWVLEERGCECFCEEGCRYCGMPGLLGTEQLEQLKKPKTELVRWKGLDPANSAERAMFVKRIIGFWEGQWIKV